MNVVIDPPEPEAAGVCILSISDERYPPLLRQIPNPPRKLYIRGDPTILREPMLAIVGSRKASPAGLRAAQALAAELVAAGLHICSGLALGIDAAAHRGALNAQGKSAAIMATGIDTVYPARHRGLARELAQAGCLVTEFPPGTSPRKGNFPRRNRIISGLSLGVLVVEAALPSGSLITAGTALEQGREVFTLPWSIFHRGGEGCLRMIRDGAKMVQTVQDVLEELGPLYALQQDLFLRSEESIGPPATVREGLQKVLDLVGYEELAVDELCRCSELPVAQVLADLSALELEGLIERRPGGYIRC